MGNPDHSAWPRREVPGLVVAALSVVAFGDILVVANKAVWPLATGFERVGPLPLLGGLGLVAMALDAFGSPGQVLGLREKGVVKTGAYRVGRHPQYLGLVLAAIGIAFVGLTGLGIAIAVGYGLVLAACAWSEERHLIGLYGDGYREYRRETGAIVSLRSTVRQPVSKP